MDQRYRVGRGLHDGGTIRGLLFATGVGNIWLLATGIADVLFAVLFAAILLRGDRAL